MAEAKTKVNEGSVDDFLAAVEPARRADCKAIVSLMQTVTRSPPKMWGSAIVGFGSYTYAYAGGSKGDWPLSAFSPRKQNLVLYLMPGFSGQPELMARLGKCKTGKSCLYINSLADIDLKVLEKLIRASVKQTKETYRA